MNVSNLLIRIGENCWCCGESLTPSNIEHKVLCAECAKEITIVEDERESA